MIHICGLTVQVIYNLLVPFANFMPIYFTRTARFSITPRKERPLRAGPAPHRANAGPGREPALLAPQGGPDSRQRPRRGAAPTGRWCPPPAPRLAAPCPDAPRPPLGRAGDAGGSVRFVARVISRRGNHGQRKETTAASKITLRGV